MLRIFRADIYRLLKSKMFYVALAAFGCYLAFCTIDGFTSVGMTYIGVGLGSVNKIYDATAASMLMYTMRTMILLPVSILPFIYLIIIADYSEKTLKNTIACGIKRETYFFAKLLQSWLVCIIMFTLTIGVPTIIAAIANGIGDGFYTKAFITCCIIRLLSLFSFTALINFITVLTKNSVSLAVSIALIFMPFIVFLFTLDASYETQLIWDKIISLSPTIGMISGFKIEGLTTSETLLIILPAAITLLLTVICGLLIFKKSEIR